MRRHNQSGNAVVMILVGVALFAALAYTFMRGGQQGQGNMSQHHARVAAQELLGFFSGMERAVNKLRSRGCSENDISFSNPADTDILVTWNHSATAPGDRSCHVFAPNGGGITFNMDWGKYQIETSGMNSGQEFQKGNAFLRVTTYDIVDLGTPAMDYMSHLNYVRPEICRAFNDLAGITSDYAALDAGTTFGDDRPEFAGKTVFCSGNASYGYLAYVWLVR